MAVTHFLKCLAPYYDAIARGDKTFEVRIDDRGYQAGDWLHLMREDLTRDPSSYAPGGGYQLAEVTYVLRGGQFGLETGYVAMAIRVHPEMPGA